MKKKKRPKDVFTLEKSHLMSISNYKIHSNNESITKTVLKDNTIQYKSNYYSVPLGTYQSRKGNLVKDPLHGRAQEKI